MRFKCHFIIGKIIVFKFVHFNDKIVLFLTCMTSAKVPFHNFIVTLLCKKIVVGDKKFKPNQSR